MRAVDSAQQDRGPSELAMLGYELDGVLADIKLGNTFDEVCRQTVERVSARLHALGVAAAGGETKPGQPHTG